MKQVIANYSFNTTAKTITLTDFTTVRLDRLALITDTTINTIIYNFADPTLATATVVGNVITLSALPGTCQNTDKLRIDYEDTLNDPHYDTGQATMVASSPVVIASDQSAIPVSQSGAWSVAQSGTWTVQAAQSGAWTVTANQGGSWTVAATQSGAWSVAQSGSWTVAATQSGSWSVNQGTAASLSGAWPVEITDGTNVLGTYTHPLIAQRPNFRDVANEQTIAVTAGNSFTGTYTYVGDISAMTLFWITELDSATPTTAPTFQIQWSNDGINSIGSTTQTVVNSGGGIFTVLATITLFQGQYYRVHITAGSANELFVLAENFINVNPYSGSFSTITSSLSSTATALLTRSVLAATKPDGTFSNVAASALNSLQVSLEAAPATASGSIFTESIRDDISVNFSNPNSLSLIQDGGSVNGTATLDATNGQVIFDTTATPGSSVIFQSTNSSIYEPGHTIRGEQTIQISALPTGNAYVEWGYGDPVNNGIGYRLTAAGLYAFRRKNGTLFATIQSSWDRDACAGGANSQFIHNGVPQALNTLFDNLYQVDFEWLGAAPISFTLKSPNGNRVLAHVIEYPNNNLGSSVPNPQMPLYVAAYNDTTSGGSLQVRCGSWRGGLLTSKISITGLNPSGTFSNVLIQGNDPGNSSSTPLAANAVFRGQWFQWQTGYVEVCVNMVADQAGTLYIDFSNAAAPVNGSDVSVNDSFTLAYDPVSNPFLRTQAPLQSAWYRVRFVNGVAAQSLFALQSILSVDDVGTTSGQLNHLPAYNSMAALTQSVELVDNGQGIGVYHQLPVDSSGFPAEHIVAFDPPIYLAALNTWSVLQTTVGATAVQIDTPTLANRRSISIVNQSSTVAVYIGQNSSVLPTSGELISPLGSSAMQLGPGAQVWAICPAGGVQTTFQRAASTASGTATTPAGAEGTSGSPTGTPGTGASAANGQTIITSGYTAGTANPIARVRLGLTGHKNPSPANETVGFVDVKTGTAGNVGSVTSASVTANANHFYLVEITRRNAAATVTSVTGMGLTWHQFQTEVGGQGAVDVWYATGVGATTGTVVASFSATATDACIAVSRYSNVNFSSPFTDFDLLAANSATISGSVSCNAGGMVVIVTDSVNRTISTATGSLTYTVQNETTSGGQAEVGTITGSASSSGPETFTVTLSGAAPYATIGLSLNPTTTVQPSVLLSYSVTAGPGTTSGSVTLPSGSDSTQYLDITSDQPWSPSLISQITYTSTTTTGAASALIDFQFVEVTDSTGNIATVSVKQMAP